MPCVSSDCFRHPWYQFCVSWQQIGSGTPRTGWAGILELPRDTKQIRGAAWCLSENALKYIFVPYNVFWKMTFFAFLLLMRQSSPMPTFSVRSLLLPFVDGRVLPGPLLAQGRCSLAKLFAFPSPSVQKRKPAGSTRWKHLFIFLSNLRKRWLSSALLMCFPQKRKKKMYIKRDISLYPRADVY